MKGASGRVLPLSYFFNVPDTYLTQERFKQLASNKKIKNFVVRKIRSDSNKSGFMGIITSVKRVLKTTFMSWLNCLPNQIWPCYFTDVQIYLWGNTYNTWIKKCRGRGQATQYDNLDDIDAEWARQHPANIEEEEDYHEVERRTIAQFINDNPLERLTTVRNTPDEQMPHITIDGMTFGGQVIPINLMILKLSTEWHLKIDDIYFVDDDGHIRDREDSEAHLDWFAYKNAFNYKSIDALRKHLVALYICAFQPKDANCSFVKYWLNTANCKD